MKLDEITTKVICTLCFILLVSPKSFALSADRDTVTYVRACGNDIGIYTENNGVLAFKVDTSSIASIEKGERIMALALMALATGKPTGYFNMSDDSIEWCGISGVRTITTFGVRSK